MRSPLTPSAMRAPTVLSMLRQYSNARDNTGSFTPSLRWPTTFETSRVACGIVHDLAHERASLTEVVVVLPLRVSGMDEFSARFPHLDLRILCGIGLWSAFGVRRVHRVEHIIHPHRSVLAVAMHRDLGPIDRDLLIVDAEAGAVRVGVRKNPAKQHLVRTGPDARDEVIGLERRLLDLGMGVGRIAAQRHPADFDERIG